MMKAKIYQFPQGDEKSKLKAEIARIKNKPLVEKRRRGLWLYCLMLFFVLRLLVAFVADIALTLAVVICHGVIYLSIILGSFFLIIKYNTNGGVWDGSMIFCATIMILGLLDGETVADWHLFQRLLGVHNWQAKQVQNESAEDQE
ncbi:hypothetical protein [Pantoea stewartii]|uniref:hypothetical protein n=1 Tax=Pantoea stewartii TaxID=66269 RepID=UPI0025A22741|nr:hypothetical protein [Pantoea stewartii]